MLVDVVGGFVDVDDPTDATGILAIGANTTKGMIGPRLEPFDRLVHWIEDSKKRVKQDLGSHATARPLR